MLVVLTRRQIFAKKGLKRCNIGGEALSLTTKGLGYLKLNTKSCRQKVVRKAQAKLSSIKLNKGQEKERSGDKAQES